MKRSKRWSEAFHQELRDAEIEGQLELPDVETPVVPEEVVELPPDVIDLDGVPALCTVCDRWGRFQLVEDDGRQLRLYCHYCGSHVRVDVESKPPG